MELCSALLTSHSHIYLLSFKTTNKVQAEDPWSRRCGIYGIFIQYMDDILIVISTKECCERDSITFLLALGKAGTKGQQG